MLIAKRERSKNVASPSDPWHIPGPTSSTIANASCNKYIHQNLYIYTNHVVAAYTINTFKNRLDKFWSDQEVLYDFNADLHGIGNRSLL